MQSMGSLRVGNDWATSLSLSCIREGNGNPLQCSCLKNPRDGGAWWAAVYGVAQSQTRLKRLSSSSSDIQWMSTESREAVCLLWAGLWWDREWWWWGSLSCLQGRGRMWLTWTSCEWGNQRTRGEIHTRAGGSAHRPRVCSAGTGKWEFGPLSSVWPWQVIPPLRPSDFSDVKWGWRRVLARTPWGIVTFIKPLSQLVVENSLSVEWVSPWNYSKPRWGVCFRGWVLLMTY